MYYICSVFVLGKLIGINEGLSELLHIPNSAKVLNLKDPGPGMWTIKVINRFIGSWDAQFFCDHVDDLTAYLVLFQKGKKLVCSVF